MCFYQQRYAYSEHLIERPIVLLLVILLLLRNNFPDCYASKHVVLCENKIYIMRKRDFLTTILTTERK
jgi:hypothetical protein